LGLSSLLPIRYLKKRRLRGQKARPPDFTDAVTRWLGLSENHHRLRSRHNQGALAFAPTPDKCLLTKGGFSHEHGKDRRCAAFEASACSFRRHRAREGIQIPTNSVGFLDTTMGMIKSGIARGQGARDR